MPTTSAVAGRLPVPTRLPGTRSRTPVPGALPSSSAAVPVAAHPGEVRRVLRRLDLSAPAVRAMQALGLGSQVELGPHGATWRPEGVDGEIRLDVEVRVDDGSDDHSLLSIITRFTATSDDARARLLDAWAAIGVLADSLTQRAARTVRDYVDDEDVTVRPVVAHAPRAA